MKSVIPEYSPEGFLAYEILLSKNNDLIVFIEDEKGVHIYESLLNRIFGDSINITQVNAVGGKKKLIEIYMENRQQAKVGKPSFFIADLDFDVFLDKDLISDINFTYLERYSIENYLVDEKVGVSFINGRNNEGITECKNKINFNNWIENMMIQFKRLIVIYATVQKLELSVENSGSSIARFLDIDDLCKIDQEKVVDYLLNTVFIDYKNKNKFGFSMNYHVLNNRLKVLYKSDSWRIIPGKQLLHIFLNYIMNHAKGKSVVRIDFENFAAQTCDLSNLDFLKSAINNLLKMPQISKIG